MKRPIIGVMGPGADASPLHLDLAQELGRRIALHDWILLTGGRASGVMDAASRGAKLVGGQTIGILPFRDFDPTEVSSAVDIPILTGLGEARNVINILTSHVVVACGMGSGTASEVSLAIKANRPVVLVSPERRAADFFTSLETQVRIADDVDHAISIIESILDRR